MKPPIEPKWPDGAPPLTDHKQIAGMMMRENYAYRLGLYHARRDLLDDIRIKYEMLKDKKVPSSMEDYEVIDLIFTTIDDIIGNAEVWELPEPRVYGEPPYEQPF